VFGATDMSDPNTLRLLAVNPEGTNLLDVRSEDAIGLPFDELVTLERVPERELIRDSLLAVARTGDGFVFDDLRLNPADPSIPIFSANVFPLPGGAELRAAL